MTGQEVSRCASDDASACRLMPLSVPVRHDGSTIEGGEPMMIMLRCSGPPVMLAVELFVRIDLRQARAEACILGLRTNIARPDGGEYRWAFYE